MLIPKKLAVPGTTATIAHAEQLKSAEEMERKVQDDLLFRNLSSVDGLQIELDVKANEKGHLFASIHADTIAAELKKQKGIDVLPEFLQLDKPLKEVGEHKILVKAQGKTGGLTVIVKAV